MKKLLGSIFFGCLLFGVFSCAAPSSIPEGYVSVHFDTNTTLETNIINDQIVKAGSLIKEPAVVFPKNLEVNTAVSGWYLEKDFTNKWNFTSDVVTKNMTLYAKWADMLSISYYLKGSESPIWVINNAKAGDPLERHDELCDGYQFYGYFEDKECTVPFDLEKPLTENTTVYMYRGESLYLHANSIRRRFSMVAAGGSGSTTGQISEVKMDPSGLSCVDVNFGYSTSGDPYMLITNPQIDISHSQKVKIKFKNFGACTNLAFYWVSQYEDGSYAGNQRNDTEANSAHYLLNGFECYMSEDDPWIEREFDLSSKLNNGVSTWGNSVKLIRLRIQFSYISKNVLDTSNVIRIASIEGVNDDKYVGFKDSEAIKSMLKDDSEADIASASEAQKQNKGVIFPKNVSTISNLSSDYYVKTDGLLLYSSYGSDINRYFFDVSDQEIDASKFSYLTLKLRNYSYISSINVYVNTLDEESGKTSSNAVNAPLAIRMNRFGKINLNFYGKNNMSGIIQNFSILFNFNGVDNAILIESISIAENKHYQIPGFNFDDEEAAGFASNSDVELIHNRKLAATKFATNKTSTSISHELNYTLDVTPYSYLKFSYIKLSAGIDNVIVKIKIGDTYQEYEIALGDASSDEVVATFDLKATGVIQELEFDFTGIGEVDIRKVEFVLDGSTSWDVSNKSIFSRMLSDWAEPITYVDDQQAALFNNPSAVMRYYFGFLYKYEYRDYGNIPLKDKSSIYLIYKNLNSYGAPFVNIYAVNSDVDSDYDISVNESSPIINNGVFAIDKNMNDDSWKVAKIDIPSMYTTGNYYLSNFALGSVGGAELEFYIRGLVVL